MKIYNLTFFCALLIVISGCNSSTNIDNKSVNTENNHTTININSKTEVVVKGEIFSPDAILDKLNQQKREFATGWNENTGIWIISTQKVKLTNEISEVEAMSIAEIRAKNQIASFMGSSMTAQEEVISTMTTIDDKTVNSEYFKSVMKIDVNQFLRGVTLFNQEIKDGKLYASFYVTGKLIDTANELDAQLRSAPPGTVRSIGFSLVVDNKTAPAKRKALQSALRNAVEQVMGTTVVGQSQLMDNDKAKSKVISQTVGNIKQYRILKEGQITDNYQIIINAEIDQKTLLDNYAAVVRSMGNPAFYINTVDPDLRTALQEFMINLGFLVVNNIEESQFLINANCVYLEVHDEHYGKGIQIDLELSLLHSNSPEILFTFRNTPRLTSTYSGSFNQVRQSAANKAFKTMKNKLHESLNKVAMDWVLNGHKVEVVFHNYNGSRELASLLEESIKWVPCAKINSKKISDNTIIFSCNYIGLTTDFEDFLLERLNRDLPAGSSLPKTTKINLNTIELAL